MSDSVTLSLPLSTRFVPTLIQCVQSVGENFGFPASVFNRLSVAAEEIFAKVADHHGETLVQVVMHNGIYRFTVDLSFQVDALDWRGFNITGDAVDLEQGDIEELGLLIAARMTDRLSLYREGSKSIGVRIERYLPHQPITPLSPDPISDDAVVHLESADPNLATLFARMVVSTVSADKLPPALRSDGLLAAMIEAGDAALTLARDAAGRLMGGLLDWPEGSQVTAFAGPYCLGCNGEVRAVVAERLVDNLLVKQARTHVLCVVSRHITPDLPSGRIEPVAFGKAPTDVALGQRAWIRLIGEDPGALAWVYGPLRASLEQVYRDLALARVLHDVDLTERPGTHDHSVLSCEIDRLNGIATLKPLWPGQDAVENLRRHARLLSQEDLAVRELVIDLGSAWQASFLPAAVVCGFAPHTLVPFAGSGDLLFLRHAGLSEATDD